MGCQNDLPVSGNYTFGQFVPRRRIEANNRGPRQATSQYPHMSDTGMGAWRIQLNNVVRNEAYDVEMLAFGTLLLPIRMIYASCRNVTPRKWWRVDMDD